MTEVIYGDVYILVNFSMDYLSLYLTGKLHHRKAPFWRMAAGALLGGIYALAALFLPPAAETVLTLLFPVVMVLAVFGYGNKKTLLKYSLTLFAVSFGLGGVMTAAYYGIGKLLTAKGIYISGDIETLYSDLPIWLLSLVALLAAIIAGASLRFAKRSAALDCYDITLVNEGRQVGLQALCDSGNLLEDPISHLPVIVVGKATVEALLPSEVALALMGKELAFEELKPAQLMKVRLIPMTTVGNQGLLRGYIPEAVEINGERKRACIAFDPADSFEEYDAILPASLL